MTARAVRSRLAASGRAPVLVACATLALLMSGGSPVSAATPSPSVSAGTTGTVQGHLSASGSNGRSVSFVLSALEDGQKPVAIDKKVVVEGKLIDSDQPARTVPSTAEAIGTSTKRSVMLLLDISGSMNDDPERFPAEIGAANQFLDVVGPGVDVGVVAFGDPAEVKLQPTQDLRKVRDVVSKLRVVAKANTAMYEAVKKGAEAMDSAGTRTLLMVSDGTDDDKGADKTPLPVAQSALGTAGAGNQVDFTGVLVGDEQGQSIFKIAGEQAVVQATRTADFDQVLRRLIQNGAAGQQRKLRITSTVPANWVGQTVSLQVRATTTDNRTVLSDPLIRDITKAGLPTASASATPATAPVIVTPKATIPKSVMIIAIIALFGALAVLVNSAVGGLVGTGDEKSAVVRRIEVYSVNGGTPTKVSVTEQTTRLGDSALTRSAVGLMSKVARSSQLDSALDGQLEAAGLPLRTAEWMLLHIGIAVGAAVVLWAIAGGQLAAMVVGLLLGLAGPWIFLTLAKARRRSKFLAQLPDTLQLLAGSLAAGYSLPQAMDAVVRETAPPISLEFNRALVEARLGMPPEDALDGIAKRTGSQDFSWIVMAIRIQRDVGGNLAELLSSVAGTLRERERLRRQVSALSAEGRLSGAILGALPLVFGLYLMLTRPGYIAPLFNTTMGLLFLVVGAIALVIGLFWMSRLIKVEV